MRRASHEDTSMVPRLLASPVRLEAQPARDPCGAGLCVDLASRRGLRTRARWTGGGSGCWDGTVRADTPMENRARKRPHGGENDDYGLSIPAPMRHGYRMPSGVQQRCGARHLYRRSSSCGEINGWVRSSCCAPGHAPPTLSRIISYLALLHAASVAVNHLASGTQPEVGRRSRREATW